MLLPLASSVPPSCGDVSSTRFDIPLPPPPPPDTVEKLKLPFPSVTRTCPAVPSVTANLSMVTALSKILLVLTCVSAICKLLLWYLSVLTVNHIRTIVMFANTNVIMFFTVRIIKYTTPTSWHSRIFFHSN